jgi:hypothetical protein
MPKPKKPTYASLVRQNMELIAGIAVVGKHALSCLTKEAKRIAKGSDLVTSRPASGVLLQLTAVGGEDIIPPIMIRDGLSLETIDALRREIQRSIDLTMSGV